MHGAIDGYMRRILWLEVGPSNNNPAIIAKYYLNFVSQHGFITRVIRADMGTENVSFAVYNGFFVYQMMTGLQVKEFPLWKECVKSENRGLVEYLT